MILFPSKETYIGTKCTSLTCDDGHKSLQEVRMDRKFEADCVAEYRFSMVEKCRFQLSLKASKPKHRLIVSF
jgi:hypothetical protein